jgi:hypothetical protein
MEWSKNRAEYSVKIATFTAFYCLAANFKLTPLQVQLDILCRLLLDVSFPFSVYVPNSTVFPMPFMRMIREFWTYQDDMIAGQITAYFVSFLVFSNFLYLGYLIYFYLDKRANELPHLTILNAMQKHMYYSSGPLAIPYICIMLNYVSCNRTQVTCTIMSASNGETAYFVIASLIHCCFVLVYETSIYEWSPLSNVPGAKAHHRATFLSSIFRCLSALIFGIFDNTTQFEVQMVLVIYCMIYNSLNALWHWYEYPYYNYLDEQCLHWHPYCFYHGILVCLVGFGIKRCR